MYNDGNISKARIQGQSDIYKRPEVSSTISPVSNQDMILPPSLIHVVSRNRWIITISIAVSLVAAFIYITNATPIYSSTSRIYVEQNGPKIINEMVNGVMMQSKNYLYNQAALLKSTPILTDAIDKPGLGQMQTFAKIDNPIPYLKENLNVSVGRNNDIISVTFDSPYPAEAAEIVNTIVGSYKSYYSDQKRSTSTDVLKILQTEKNKRSEELKEKLNSMMEFMKKNESLTFDGSKGNIVIDRLQTLSDVLFQAQLETIDSNNTYNTIREVANDPVKLQEYIAAQETTGTNVTSGNIKTELKSRLEVLKSRLSDKLRSGLTSNHPSVIAMKSDIENIEKRLNDIDTLFINSRLSAAKQRYLAAKEKEEHISEYYEKQRQEVRNLNEQLAQYTILQSDVDQTKKYCDIIDDQIRGLNMTEDVGALNIWTLEYARAADVPSKPQKSRYMAFALIIGVIMGGGLSLIHDLMDQKLHTAEEISSSLGMPLLGVVPSMSKKENASERGRKVFLDSRSYWAEAYRTIRTAIFFSAPKEKAKTILVTSPTPSDGKTTLVSNLAITMAQAGQKTLIIDADFRKPTQHNIFGINHTDIGIISVLSGTSTLREAIKPTGIQGLGFLSRGPDVTNPSEVLSSLGFSKLIEYLSTKFDRVIIDSPPVTSVTDAQILSAICDITILVLRAEKSTRKTSQQAQHNLINVGAHILGIVVNDAPKTEQYGYYGGYGNYYVSYGIEKNPRKSIKKLKQYNSAKT